MELASRKWPRRQSAAPKLTQDPRRRDEDDHAQAEGGKGGRRQPERRQVA